MIAPGRSFGKTVKYILNDVVAGIFGGLEWLVPKDPRLVLFGQARGRFSDNSRALYEEMTTLNGHVRAVWLANDGRQEDLIRLKCPAGVVVRKLSVKGVWFALRAGVVMFSHGSGDFSPWRWISRRTLRVMLWHGTAIKAIGVLDRKLCRGARDRYLAYESARYSHWLVGSEMERLATSACHGIRADRVVVTGQPRNDRLVRARYSFIRSGQDKGITNVLYAPTFRENGESVHFFPFPDLDYGELARALERLRVKIMLRPHINDVEAKNSVGKLTSEFPSMMLDMSVEDFSDLGDILHSVDIVVTDYSSVFLDLLLVDVPCIFLPYDLEPYREGRGLLYDYDLVTPGPKPTTQNEFINAIEDAIGGGETWGEARRRVRRMFHAYQDAGASSRVVEWLQDIWWDR